ncbi:MAG: hypothetical protein C0467_09635 [Planctomycetaceae bacterium]|nr:hypothetical protein [Planctomycetaceae bacterium]
MRGTRGRYWGCTRASGGRDTSRRDLLPAIQADTRQVQVTTTRNRPSREASLAARTEQADAATVRAHLDAHDAAVAVMRDEWPGIVVGVDFDAVVREGSGQLRDPGCCVRPRACAFWGSALSSNS